jgi:hypothetical protein
MTEKLSITMNTSQTADFVAIASGDPRMKRALVGGIRKSMAEIERIHKREVIGRGIGNGKPKSDVWSVRTNEAGRSFHRVVDAQAVEGAYGSELQRVAVLELGSQVALGGPIRPRNATYLAIPTEAAKVGVGAALSPRFWPRGKLAFVQSLKGNPLLLDSDTGEVMFVLRRSVTVPPRPTLQRTQELAQPKVDAAMMAAVDEALTPKGGVKRAK